jgi:hypothetical protein
MIRRIYTWVYCLLLPFAVFAQKKQLWNNSFLYSFKLAPEIPLHDVEAIVLYKGKIIIPAFRKIGGAKQPVSTRFNYSVHETGKAGAVTLPFVMPGGNFVWLMDAGILTEMTLYPDRYKIRISITHNNIAAEYTLPEIFDFIPDHALNIAYLQSFSEQDRNRKINENTWILSLQAQTTMEDKARDTILTYSLSTVPKGILLTLPAINKTADTTQHFIIEKAFFYNGRLLMPVPVKKVDKLKSMPDQCHGILTDTEGRSCATSGCITGRGSGDCAALKTTKNKLQYRVFVIVSP